MKLKDLTTEELTILSDFETSEFYPVLKKWIEGKETHHALMALSGMRPNSGNENELTRELIYRAGRLDEGKRILALSKKAKDFLNISKKKNGRINSK